MHIIFNIYIYILILHTKNFTAAVLSRNATSPFSYFHWHYKILFRNNNNFLQSVTSYPSLSTTPPE